MTAAHLRETHFVCPGLNHKDGRDRLVPRGDRCQWCEAEKSAAAPDFELVRSVLAQADSSRWDDATAALARIERDLDTLRGFYDSVCEDVLSHDKANETVRTTVERIRETADLAQEALETAGVRV